MMKLIKIIPFISLSAALLVASCGSDSDSRESTTTAAIEVRTATVKADSLSSGLMVNGRVVARNSAQLSTRMMGFVERIPVKIGDRVRKGQLLVAINNSDLAAKRAQADAGIAAAQAAFENAEKDLERFTNLYNSNSASRKELDDMTTRYNMAKAQLETAREMKNEVDAQLTYVNIRSPFDGVVTNIFTDEGNMANPGQPLVGVDSPGSGFEVEAAIPESAINTIDRGASVKVYLKTLDRSLKGELSEISSSSANTGGQYTVKVNLPEEAEQLRAGMYAQLEFALSDTEVPGAVLVPLSALVKQGQLSGIYTVSSRGTAILRWLRLGRTLGDQVEVLSGLSPGEEYVVSANGKLFNGVSLSIQ